MAVRWNQIQNLLVTEAEINLLVGLTADAADLNTLSGFTGTVSDLNDLVGTDIALTAHEATNFTTAHPIAAGSLDGLLITDNTIIQSKMAFNVAIDTDITGLQIQIDDAISDTAVQQTQIDNLFDIVIPGQGSDISEAIDQTIAHISLVENAHDASAISYGNYYSLPSDIIAATTTSLIFPLSIIKFFRSGESLRFKDDITPSEDVVITTVNYTTGQVIFPVTTNGYTTADNGIVWTLAEDQVQEALNRSFRNDGETKLVLREGTFKGEFIPQTLTADRTWTLPDADVILGIPLFTGEALKYLRVNVGETSGEWTFISAPEVTYDNTISGLVATDVKDAIDELAASGGLTKADYHDPITTVLPTGTTVTIDGNAGVNGDLVLFSNLLSNNNRIYSLSGVGVSLVWTPESLFSGSLDPSLSDMTIITKGDAFAQAVGVFDGTLWDFNDTVRYFSGADFWEISSIKTSTLTNNTTGNVFVVNATGSENIIVDYSIVRGVNKETGQIIITSDTSSANAAKVSVDISSTGVDLFADINTGDVRLRYVADNSGPDATIKYIVKRWSDTIGGPTGIPNYSSAIGSGAAGGSPTEIQFHGAGGALDGSPELIWDDTNKNINLDGLNIAGVAGPLTLNDAQAVPLMVINKDAALYKFMVLEYSVVRAGNSRTGRMLVSNDGTISAFSDDFIETAITGIIFSAAMSGSNIEILYTSTSTGSTGSFNYTVRYWN